MIDLNPEIATTLLQTLAGRLDAGGAAAKLRLYTGPKPAPGGALTTQILLGSVDLPKPFAQSVNGATLQPAPIPNMLLDVSGIAAWARFVGGDGAWAWDCAVSDENGSAFIRIQGGTTVLAGGIIFITTGVLTIG